MLLVLIPGSDRVLPGIHLQVGANNTSYILPPRVIYLLYEMLPPYYCCCCCITILTTCHIPIKQGLPALVVSNLVTCQILVPSGLKYQFSFISLSERTTTRWLLSHFSHLSYTLFIISLFCSLFSYFFPVLFFSLLTIW